MNKTAKRQHGAFSAFLRDVAGSCYDMRRYREFRTSSLGAGIRYFLAYSLLVTVILSLATLPSALGLLRDVRNGIATSVPDGVVFAIENGAFSTTLDMPFESEVEDLRVLVDTGIEGTGLPEGRVDGTAAVVGKDAVFFIDDGTAQTYAFKDMEDARVSKEEIVSWLRRNGVLLLIAGMGAFGIGYFLALVLGVGVFVLATALLAMLLARLFRVRMPYGAWLATGLHAATLPVLADLAFHVLITPVPFVFTLLYLMILVAVLADERADPALMEPESRKV